MSEPPLNRSPEAVRLREVAMAWGRQKDNENDPHDRAGQRLNKELLTAALAYANAVYHAQPVLKQEDPVPRKKPIHAHPSGVDAGKGEPLRWECLVCGRDKFTKRTPHKCLGGYRKRNLKWRPIYAEPVEAPAA